MASLPVQSSSCGLSTRCQLRRSVVTQLPSRVQPAGSRTAHVKCFAGPKDELRRSFDSEDDLDGALSAELNSAVDPTRLLKMANRLNLTWAMARVSERLAGAREQQLNRCQTAPGGSHLQLGALAWR